MFAVYAESFAPDDPLSGLVVGERPDPEVPDGWTTVTVKAASLNHHDLWSLRGVGLKQEQLPMILGCDAAGVTPDGREVVVHAVVAGDGGPGTDLDAPFSILSERHPGTHAERVAVPAGRDGPMVPRPTPCWQPASHGPVQVTRPAPTGRHGPSGPHRGPAGSGA
jgi:NADPH:quinone reductase-like Zn-dependent oxidoreductase